MLKEDVERVEAIVARAVAAQPDTKNVKIESRCSCGGYLYIEVPGDAISSSAYDCGKLREIALGFINAHAQCTKGKATP